MFVEGTGATIRTYFVLVSWSLDLGTWLARYDLTAPSASQLAALLSLLPVTVGALVWLAVVQLSPKGGNGHA